MAVTHSVRPMARREVLLQLLPEDGAEMAASAILAALPPSWRGRPYTTLYELQRDGLVAAREEPWAPEPRERLFYRLADAGQAWRRAASFGSEQHHDAALPSPISSSMLESQRQQH